MGADYGREDHDACGHGLFLLSDSLSLVLQRNDTLNLAKRGKE